MSIRDDMKCFYYTFVCFECHVDWWHYCYTGTTHSRICTLDNIGVIMLSAQKYDQDGKYWHVISVYSHLIKSTANVYAGPNQTEIFENISLFEALIEYFIISPRSHESDVAKMNSSRIILLKIGIKTPEVHYWNFNFNKTFSLERGWICILWSCLWFREKILKW